MSLTDVDGRAVHFPKNKDRFEFDDEVASVFQDIAKRSIPLYEETHAVHADIAAERLRKVSSNFVGEYVPSVADLGCSTGRFLRVLCNRLGSFYDGKSGPFSALAVDTSPYMIGILEQMMPWVVATDRNILDVLRPRKMKFDVVNMSYVLQFINPMDRAETVLEVYESLNPGGVFLFSQKERISGYLSCNFAKQYNEFKLSNGYSQEEIDAKTKALGSVMSVDYGLCTEETLRNAGFVDIQPTTRWLQFSSFVCRKPG